MFKFKTLLAIVLTVSSLSIVGCSTEKDVEAEVSMPTTNATSESVPDDVVQVETPADQIDAAPLENEQNISAASEADVAR